MMNINSYFGFTKNPFPRSVYNKDVYRWQDFDDLSNRLHFFLNQGGIFLLTGLIGSGKTTALRVFSSSLNPNSYRVVYFSDVYSNKRDLYRTILTKIDVTAPFYYGDAREILRKQLLEMYYIKKLTPILIFDEAQNLNGFILEELRLLSNFDFDSKTPVLFIIAGHNKLKQRIVLKENEALNQRISMRFHFNGMSQEQTFGYINHCLNNSDSTNAIFTDTVLQKIHEITGGVPRDINNKCNNLLLSAMILEKKLVDDNVYEKTAGEWQ